MLKPYPRTCATCDQKLEEAREYVQVRTEGSPLLYFCDRACMLETAHYAPQVYEAITSATHKRRAYQAPALTRYGGLEELTKEGGNVGDDGLSGSKAAI